jgi:preprotein translocase subunit SecE
MKSLKEFIKESIAELKKVSWPSKDDVKESTIIVLITVVVAAVFLGAVDKITTIIIQLVLK